jgi:hypothetical protein
MKGNKMINPSWHRLERLSTIAIIVGALIHSGQDEAAVAYFKKALELEPDYEDARTALRNLGAQ